MRQRETREEERKAWEEQCLAEMAKQKNTGPSAEEIEALNNEFAKDARARLFWIYRTRDMKELKVFLNCMRFTHGKKEMEKTNHT